MRNNIIILEDTVRSDGHALSLDVALHDDARQFQFRYVLNVAGSVTGQMHMRGMSTHESMADEAADECCIDAEYTATQAVAAYLGERFPGVNGCIEAPDKYEYHSATRHYRIPGEKHESKP
jgi:hypothetical protein